MKKHFAGRLAAIVCTAAVGFAGPRWASAATVGPAAGSPGAAARLPLPAAVGGVAGYLDVGHGRLHYQACGSAEVGRTDAIVLLHDGILSSAVWDGEWNALCARFRVVRYDRRGYGLSDPPSQPFLQADDLRALLQHLNLARVTLVGCSSGGGHAIDFALHYPEMVSRLILLGSVLHGMTVSSQFDERGRRMNAPLKSGNLAAAARNWSHDPYTIAPGHDAARRRFYDALMAHPRSLQYTGELEIRYRHPAILRLAEIHVPTLILVGEFDMPDVQAFGGAIKAGIPGARREIVSDSAHLIPLEQPAYLTRRIEAFIARYPAASIAPDTLAVYAGDYELFGTSTIALRQRRLYLRAPGEKELPLFPVSASKLRGFLWSQDGEIEFVKDASGKVSEMVIHAEDGTVTHCRRVG